MREVARVSTPISDEELQRFVTVAESIYGPDLAAQGDQKWLTLYAPSNV